MSELSPQARKIIEAARRGDDPTPQDRARVRGALVRSLAAGTVLAAAATSGKSVAAGLTLKALVAVVAGTVVTGAVTVGVVRHLRHRSTVPTSAAPRGASLGEQVRPPALAPSTQITTAGSQPATAPPPEAAGRTAAPHRAHARAAATTANRTLEAETQGLREVHAALQASRPAQALRLLTAQMKIHRGGQLGEERAAARALALCQLHPGHAAAEALGQFQRTHPRSPLLPRVRAACTTPHP